MVQENDVRTLEITLTGLLACFYRTRQAQRASHEEGEGGKHTHPPPEIYLCVTFRVSTEAHFIQDKSEVSPEERNAVSTFESCLLN